MTTVTHPGESTETITAREWSLSRDVSAPRELVFKAWIVPSLVARWWGPEGFTTPVCDIDPRPGGAYRIVLRDPAGAEYPLKGIYLEVAEPERIVMTEAWDEHPPEWQKMLRDLHEGDDEPAQEALTTVTFDEHDGVTTVTVRTLFETTAVRDAMVKMGTDDGWSQSFDRLDDLLSRL
jgi:uncharacterized protein YndB with AHSA1/START domain